MAYAYYVYYRVAHSREADCRKAALEILDAVQRSTGIAGRLLKKRDEPLLWMEVYENVRDGRAFESRLAHAVARSGMQDCLEPGGPRRVECFEI